ncbi:MAG: transketolase [Treponemataceae bacterium]|nr:transketolase [Treponemataceae bacterium]
MKGLNAAALSIRSLSMDAIQKAKSGHPGMPLGCAELGAALYGELLNHNPENPKWINRDRFVLSAGHASMLLYSVLHMSGYNLTIDDIKQFRQLGSKCPGHPEVGETDGVDASTGPLGQGITMAVGMAMAETMLAAKYNTAEHKIIDHYTYALCGEGCLMEGISHEAGSLAGHLKLGKLIVFYDMNQVSIDGPTSITFTEDIGARFESYGWQVLKGSMYSYDDIFNLTAQAKKDTERPTLIMLKSEIGHGAPSVAGLSAAHGAPIGEEGVKEAKKNLGLNPDEYFYVSPDAYEYFNSQKARWTENYNNWKADFDAWAKDEPELKKEWDAAMSNQSIQEMEALPEYKIGDKLATRAASGNALQVIAKAFPQLVGGSADLEGSNSCKMKSESYYGPANPAGRNIHFGIREFAMTTACNGMLLHGGLRTYCATFMVFADYMRPAIRIASLMKLPAIYVLTHDSIYVGEDGPTHQPVETLESLRTIPGVQVLRPADAEETSIAWKMAINETDHPVCLVLGRQGLPVFEKADKDWKKNIEKGAYLAYDCQGKADITILATGSEVSLAIDAAKIGKDKGKNVRVISVMDRELFASQDESFQKELIGDVDRVMTIEAGLKAGWEEFATSKNDIISIDRFGLSAPAAKVGEFFGFTPEKVAEKF